MAITTDEKVDALWKRSIFGVSKTANASTKFGSNETIPSALPVVPSNIWTDGDSIPTSPPGATTSLVTVFATSAAIQMTNDSTAPANQTWLACATPGDAETRMADFIAPTFGTGYAVKVWLGDPDGGPAARIFPDTSNEEWVFDYAAGVLYFYNNIPASRSATVGSGSVSISDGVYIEVYQYTGDKGGAGGGGATSLGDLSDVETGTGTPVEGSLLTYKDGVWQAEPPGGSGGLGTMSTQNANNVNITGGSISNVTLNNVSIDGGVF